MAQTRQGLLRRSWLLQRGPGPRSRGRSATANVTRRLWPLTERILAHLPGRRALWILAWAVVPWLNAGANLLLETGARSAVWEQRRALVLLNYAALSFAIVITLWGTERIARRLETLRATTSNVLEGDSREPFRELNSVVGPLAASAATALAFALSALVEDGWTSAILRGATWILLGIPLWTFLWTYVSLQLGLDRLGRERLPPDAVRIDSTLGLRPLGGVAFTGLWMLLAWLVPVLLTGLPDVVGVAIGVVVLSGALATFFLSLLRLHRQMVEVKASELAIARELYAQAYEPVRTAPTLDALEQQHRLLGAADALEKRAHAIHEWPIDEGMVARVITITTSVIAITVGRLILDPLGL
jgi:hypothetical protein